MDIKYDLYKLKIKTKYKNFFKFFDEINQSFNCIEVLPDHFIKDYELHIAELDKEVDSLDKDFRYIENIERYNNLLRKICPSTIDRLAYKAFLAIEKNSTISSNLKSFKPLNGKCKSPKYKLFSNVSGRLIVENGRNILTLPRRCRNIFKSSFQDGRIISVDFNNLEPRIALKISGKTNISEDIYSYIIDHLSLDVDRSVVKNIVISILYGMNLKGIDYLSKEKYDSLKNHIKELFDIDNLLKISSHIDNNGIRRNFCGKPLWNLEEDKNHILINNFIQSTAVDIAMTYFCNLVNKIDSKLCQPIFLIHDAIVFDVNPQYFNTLEELVKLGHNDKILGNFPLSTSIFNKEE